METWMDIDSNLSTARYEAGNGGLPETRQVCQSHAGDPLQGSIFSNAHSKSKRCALHYPLLEF